MDVKPGVCEALIKKLKDKVDGMDHKESQGL
jgi:hypothetical protein